MRANPRAVSTRAVSIVLAVGAASLSFMALGYTGVATGQNPAPVVTWHTAAVGVAGLRQPFTYSSSGIGARSSLAIQEKLGSAWVTEIKILKRLYGTGSFELQNAGLYYLRIADIGPTGQVYASEALRVREYPVPKVAWSTAVQVTAGAPMNFNWQASGLIPGGQLVIQRKEGTVGVWNTVAQLTGAVGSEQIPGLPLGIYQMRIADVSTKGQVYASQLIGIESYGPVPLTNLCQEANNSNAISVGDLNNGCSTSTIQVGSSIFTYLIEDENGTQAPQYDTTITSQQTSCRSITLQWAIDNNAGSGDSASVEIVQANADPQQASTPYGQIGNATFSLTGAAWYLDNWVSGSDNEYINAEFSCYTPTGLP
jgi:hypothetical protein